MSYKKNGLENIKADGVNKIRVTYSTGTFFMLWVASRNNVSVACIFSKTTEQIEVFPLLCNIRLRFGLVHRHYLFQ